MKILACGVSVDQRDILGNTPLHYLCEFGNAVSVRHLLSNGVDPNVQNRKGETCLHRAAEAGNEEVVALLSQKVEVDLNIKDNQGDTALLTSLRHGHAGTGMTLVEKGANTQITGWNGWTALHCASAGDLPEVLQVHHRLGL